MKKIEIPSLFKCTKCGLKIPYEKAGEMECGQCSFEDWENGFKDKHAVFSDYCDAGQEIFDTYEEAKAEFERRKNDENENGVDVYLCKVIEEYHAK
ncbi:hypothetical protein GBG21_17000 [Aeribacillus pallidus]|jgi:hypothetical protein|nr:MULTISPECIES: hypothetical protein [Aeribacillus]MDR9794586.1 hypothetical protein [Aeribacillus pallidus]MED1437230.1 hypothetical protein [Aeribacillus composti]